VSITRTPLTTEEAIARIRADYPRDGNVMAQNYDHDCPNSDDHTIDPVTGFEVCECWDGLTVDDIDTWTDNGAVDLDGFAQWGQFELWLEDPQPLDAATVVARRIDFAGVEAYSPAQVAEMALAALAANGFVVLAPQDLEWGECPGTPGEPHRVSTSLCSGCLEYDPD
jgi:hypothetical protein